MKRVVAALIALLFWVDAPMAQTSDEALIKILSGRDIRVHWQVEQNVNNLGWRAVSEVTWTLSLPGENELIWKNSLHAGDTAIPEKTSVRLGDIIWYEGQDHEIFTVEGDHLINKANFQKYLSTLDVHIMPTGCRTILHTNEPPPGARVLRRYVHDTCELVDHSLS